jgi:hypothetical protein
VLCSPPSISSGSATLSCLTIGVLPGPSGAGVLATVDFLGLAEGKSPATLNPVTLATITGVSLDVNVTDGAIDVDARTSGVGVFTCSANAPVTSSSGDNDGFENNAEDACIDDGAQAADNQTGTNANTTCADSGKDRHVFGDFDIDVPGTATIDGIEVRLDGRANNSSSYLCAELSWDGGNTWTSPQFTFGLGTAEATHWLGAPDDIWGHVWNGGGDWSNGNFLVRVTSVSNDPNANIFLDFVEVHFYYTD